MDYFIAGGGALTGEEGEDSTADVQWVGAGYSSIAVASVTKENFTVSYYNVNNELLYKYTRVKVEEVETSSPSSYPSTTPTIEEKGSDSFSNFETALFTFYASCSALGVFAFVFLFLNAYSKVVGARSTKDSYIDLKSVDKYFEDSRDDDNCSREAVIEAQNLNISSPAPPRHLPHAPHPQSVHPYAHMKQPSTSPSRLNASHRYLTSTAHRSQSYRHDYREQERLRNMGFGVIP